MGRKKIIKDEGALQNDAPSSEIKLEKKILLKCTIPVDFLPSVNEMYKRGRGGRVYLDPQYKALKEDIAKKLSIVIPNPPEIKSETPLQVTIGYYSNGNIKKSDVDNMNKCTIDAIMTKFLGVDDCNIWDLYCYKRGVKGSNSCFIYVKIETLPKSYDELLTVWDKLKLIFDRINSENEGNLELGKKVPDLNK